MRYAACVIALVLVWQAAPAAGQVAQEPAPEATHYVPSLPVTAYPAPLLMTTYYRSPYHTSYAPALAYHPARYFYVPRRVARRWYRKAFYW